MYRIGILFPVRLEPPDAVAALFGELKRGGFVEGKNLTAEFRPFAPHPDRIPDTKCGHKGATLQHPGWAGAHIGFQPFPLPASGS
jgi:hypothetical protein